MTVLLQVCTLFVLMLCGLFAMQRKLIAESGVQGLNTLVLSYALPALIIRRMQTTASPELITDLIWVFALSCVTMALAGFIAWAIFRREPEKRRGVLTNLSMASNCAFMGYPVVTAALGEDALIYAVIYVAGFNLMCWTLGAFFFGGAKAMQPKKLLRNPSLIGVVFGITLFLTTWRLPGFINDALDMLGATTTPVAMFVVGARLVTLRWSHLQDLKLILACMLRLVFFPAAILLLTFTPIPRMAVIVTYLCTAMPGAAVTAMQAEMFDCDRSLASRGVALSTAMSMATVPLMLMLI